MNEQKQGFYVVGQFDRVFEKERTRDGVTTRTKHVGLLVRTDNGGTQVVSVKTDKPERFSTLKRDELVRIPVRVGAFKDYVFFTDAG